MWRSHLGSPAASVESRRAALLGESTGSGIMLSPRSFIESP
jgi:hypothetical protein